MTKGNTQDSLSREGIIQLLADYPKEHAERFASYIIRLRLKKNRDGTLQNPWMVKKTNEQMAEMFRRVDAEGLVFDGDDITLQSTGISYGYNAFKNKMLLAYPESQIDTQLVFKGDEFSFSKEDGKVKYTHKIANPFSQKDADLIGGYNVIKNSRGEYLVLLSPEDIAKHRKAARTDKIWRQWFKEMCMKTLIKKGCKQHFKDVFKGIEDMDNENYDLDNPIDIEVSWKSEVEEINTIDELREYWQANKGRGKDFDKLVMKRKQELQNV